MDAQKIMDEIGVFLDRSLLKKIKDYKGGNYPLYRGKIGRDGR